MQSNSNSNNFKKISIEILAANPRNGQILIEALVKFLDYQNFKQWKQGLETTYSYCLGSQLFHDEADEQTFMNIFFAFNRIKDFFDELEKAMNIIAPNSIHSIELSNNQNTSTQA